MPAVKHLWTAQTAIRWRTTYLKIGPLLEERPPPLPRCIRDTTSLSRLQLAIEIRLSTLIVLYGISTLIWEYRQLSSSQTLRDASAIFLYHASLVLRAYAVVSGAQGREPHEGAPESEEAEFVWLDGEDDLRVQRFLKLDRGVSAIRRWAEEGQEVEKSDVGTARGGDGDCD